MTYISFIQLSLEIIFSLKYILFGFILVCPNVKPVAIFQFICGGERADVNFPLITGPVMKVFSKSEIYTIFCSPCERSVIKEIPLDLAINDCF